MPLTHPFKNLVGQPFGSLTVTRLVTDTGDGNRVWVATCRVCGLDDEHTEYRLRRFAVRATEKVRRPGCWHRRGRVPTPEAPVNRRPKPPARRRRSPRPLQAWSERRSPCGR